MSYTNENLRETHTIGNETQEYFIGPQAAPSLALYHIRLAGISYARSPFRFVRLRPQLSQILACLEGQGEVFIDGHWHLCKPGMAYLTPPDVFHAYRALPESSAAWKLCWVTYALNAQIQPLTTLDCPTLIHTDPLGLATAIEGLYHECLDRADENLIHQWAHLLHSYALRLAGQDSFDGRLHRLWKMVDANLTHPWRCRDLAAMIDMSSEHLRRLCQQQFGHSPMKHITIMRMQRAMALLVSDTSSIEAIAAHVGYDNPFAFSTAFKRYAGMNPSTYRSTNRHW